MTGATPAVAALIGALLFWIAADVQFVLATIRTYNRPTPLALGVIAAPLLVHAAVAVLVWLRQTAGAARLLGAVDVLLGCVLLGVLAYEAMAYPDWQALWQLEAGGPPRLIWAVVLCALGVGPLTTRARRRTA